MLDPALTAITSADANAREDAVRDLYIKAKRIASERATQRATNLGSVNTLYLSQPVRKLLDDALTAISRARYATQPGDEEEGMFTFLVRCRPQS